MPTWARTRRSATLSCTPFTVLCSRFFKNPAARRSPSSQTPRQPYSGLHPTHQAQDSDTLSQSYNRHTTYGNNEESPSNSDGPQPCRHRRHREGRRVGKDGSTERTRPRVTALRVQQHVPGPPEARYHRAEVGRGMLMDGVALEQAPRAQTTEEDAARPARRRPKLAKRWPRASTSSGRGTPSPGRTSRRSGSAPATPVGYSSSLLKKSAAQLCWTS